MSSTKNVQNTHISTEQLRALHGAVIDVVAAIIGPQRDELLIREAGIRLDRALFPLLVLIERMGPIGVVELADHAGRDYTTISRQLAKLEELCLVAREASPTDRRSRVARVTQEGKRMAESIDIARDRLLRALFADWTPGEFETFIPLLRRFADGLKSGPAV